MAILIYHLNPMKKRLNLFKDKYGNLLFLLVDMFIYLRKNMKKQENITRDQLKFIQTLIL